MSAPAPRPRRPFLLLAMLLALVAAAPALGSTAGVLHGAAKPTSTKRAAAKHKPKPKHKPTRDAHATGIPVPGGFVGMDISVPLMISGNGLSLAEQFADMARAGVQTIRVAFNWADEQPYASWSDVPSDQTGNFVDANGMPTNFAETDQVVALAALYGLRVLPVVIYTPSWDAGSNPQGLAPPQRLAPYAAYLTALIDRYGPNGTYWQSYSPKLPIRQWQIWNEPDLPYYWPQPSVKSYLALLGAAHAAVKAADPTAQTVIAALTNDSWNYLAWLYAVKGTSGLFDVAAVNAFTAQPKGVITILGLVRRAMAAAGDGSKPLLATEVSWTSAHGAEVVQHDWDTTETGQARHIAALVPLLATARRSLHLAGFFYYTWINDETQPTADWNYAGLLKVQSGQAIVKPALGAFTRAALAVEGCTGSHPASGCPGAG